LESCIKRRGKKKGGKLRRKEGSVYRFMALALTALRRRKGKKRREGNLSHIPLRGGREKEEREGGKTAYQLSMRKKGLQHGKGKDQLLSRPKEREKGGRCP